ESRNGKLILLERSDARSQWRQVGKVIPAMIGEKGLGWGKGLHQIESNGRVKKEGVGKEPAGVFRLTNIFGYASDSEAQALRMPYIHLTPALECVDDSSSKYYNKFVDRSKIRRPDWRSSEIMLRSDDLYKWGVVVAHNFDDPE